MEHGRLVIRTEVTLDGNLEGEIVITASELAKDIEILKSEANEHGLSLYISGAVFDKSLQSYISNGDYELLYKG